MEICGSARNPHPLKMQTSATVYKRKEKLVLCLSISVGRGAGSYPVGRQFESVLRHHDAGKWGMSDAPTDHSPKIKVLAHFGQGLLQLALGLVAWVRGPCK